MQILINVALTDEELLIVAKEKGYQETVPSFTQNSLGQNVSYVNVPNPVSAFDFLSNAYEAVIVADVSKHYINYMAKKKESEKTLIEKEIRQTVNSAVTSFVS